MMATPRELPPQTTIDSPTSTSTTIPSLDGNRGDLTSTFNVPAWCTSTATIVQGDRSTLFLAHYFNGYNRCYPQGTQDPTKNLGWGSYYCIFSLRQDFVKHGINGFFPDSPGVYCPSSYTTAATWTTAWNSMTSASDRTGALCCPRFVALLLLESDMALPPF